MWEHGRFEASAEKGAVKEFEKIMLSSGRCRMFIPMAFMSEGDEEKMYFFCSGFAPLSSYRIERTDDALFLLERTAVILKRSVEYMIMPSNITISTDTVFYSKENEDVRVAYIPLREDERDLRRNMVRFTGQLMADIRDGHRQYLRELAGYIYCSNYSMKDLINRIALLRRQLRRAEQVKRSECYR